MSPAEIRRALAAVEASIARHRAELAADERQAMLLRQMLEVEPGLHSAHGSAKVSGTLQAAHKTAEHRAAISAGMAAAADTDDAAFIGTINRAGYSIRSLAIAVGKSQATLQAHRRPKAHRDSRPCPQSRADKIQALTGWPADARHWPAGLS